MATRRTLWSRIALAIRAWTGASPNLPLASKRPPLSQPKNRMLTRMSMDWMRASAGRPMKYRWAEYRSTKGPSTQGTTAPGAPQ